MIRRTVPAFLGTLLIVALTGVSFGQMPGMGEMAPAQAPVGEMATLLRQLQSQVEKLQKDIDALKAARGITPMGPMMGMMGAQPGQPQMPPMGTMCPMMQMMMRMMMAQPGQTPMPGMR